MGKIRDDLEWNDALKKSQKCVLEEQDVARSTIKSHSQPSIASCTNFQLATLRTIQFQTDFQLCIFQMPK